MALEIGFSTGYQEAYWGDWLTATQLGGSENIIVQLAKEYALAGHSVTVRLPYQTQDRVWSGVLWTGDDATSNDYDLLFCADDYNRKDRAARSALIACRSDPPAHTDFDQLIFLSAHHARLMGHAGRPHVGGGVHLSDYALDRQRLPRRVICCSSPDRCPQALAIGRAFDFRHSYKKVGNYPSVELSREGLIDLQQTAQAMVYPLDPRRPSDFFSMAVLECLAAGTPVVVSDADSMPELWSDAAIVLPRPIRLSQWYETVERLLTDPQVWRARSAEGRIRAAFYDWPLVAEKYLKVATA